MFEADQPVKLLLFLLFPATVLAAGGYEKPSLWSAEAVSLGGAMVAHTRDSQALYFNPAGLDGNSWSFHFALADGSSAAPVVPNQSETTSSSAPIPLAGLLYTKKINERFSFGAGLYALGGNDVSHPKVSFAQVDSSFADYAPDVYGKLSALEFAVGGAWRVNPKLRLGIALRAQMVNGSFAQAQVSEARNLGGFGIPDGTILAASGAEIEDIKGTYFGSCKLGAQYDLSSKTQLGISYRSAVDMKLKGDAQGEIVYTAAGAAAVGANAGQTYALRGGSTNVESSFPQALTMGVAHSLENNWVMHAEYGWTEYAANRALKLDGNLTNTADNSVNALEDSPLRWHSMHDFKLGLAIPAETLLWRAGYALTLPVSDRDFAGSTTAAPGIYHHVAGGFGKRIKLFKHDAQWDNALEFYYGEGNGKTPQAVTSTSAALRAQGTWRTQAWALFSGLSFPL